MNFLFLINDGPYGTEKAYNAMRWANQMLKDYPDATVRIFLMADAAQCAIKGQETPQGFYNIERMLKIANNKGAEIGVCGGCADARGIQNAEWVHGARKSSMEELAQWTVEADKVITF